MTITVASNPTVFTVKQRQIIYTQGGLLPANPYTNGSLAPSTAIDPTYKTGTLLAKYGANAPTPDLVGTYVNYDPASLNDDQKVCVGLIAQGEFINGISGVVLTTPTTTAATINAVQIALFQNDANVITGWLINSAVLTDTTVNSGAVITGFNATFKTAIVATAMYDGVANNIITVTGLV